MTTPGPSMAFLLPTGRCNLRCSGCYATLEEHGRHSDAQELDAEGYRAIVHELAGMGVRTFDISGGEPLLYPHIGDICEAIREHPGTRTWLVTNGTVGEKGRLRRLGPLERLVFSLDGPSAPQHDQLRGAVGTFDKTLRTLRTARDMAFGELAINFMVSRQSIGDAAAMLRLARDEQVDRLAFLTFRDVSENGVMFELIPSLRALKKMWREIQDALAASAWPASVDLVVPAFLFPESTAFRKSLPPELRTRIVLHHPHLRGHSAYRETLVVKPTGQLSGDTAMVNDALFDIGAAGQGITRVWEEQAPRWRATLAERAAKLKADAPCRDCSRWHYCRGGCPAAAMHQWSTLQRHDRSCDAFRANGDF